MGKLKYVSNRVIVSVDMEYKNWHTFSSGLKIRRERDYNEFNRRITMPTNAIVLSAENIPEGSEILIGHNSLHESNRIYNYTGLSGDAVASDIKYYSLPEEDCYAWRDEKGELKPITNFAFALRVYKPYEGRLSFITPDIIKDVLYITTGELAGNVCHVLKASDYEIIFQGIDGQEDRRIRCRHYEGQNHEREEIIAVSHDLTDRVKSGELIIGLSPTTSKTLN